MAKVFERDLGLDAYVAKVESARGKYTKVGLPEEEQPVSKKGGVATMSELVTVGAVHEFGAPSANIPERPWLRSAVDENRNAIIRRQTAEIERVLSGKQTLREGLARVGEWFAGRVKRKITTLQSPPLKASTIRKKGSSSPLIDTGQMRASITHVEKV